MGALVNLLDDLSRSLGVAVQITQQFPGLGFADAAVIGRVIAVGGGSIACITSGWCGVVAGGVLAGYLVYKTATWIYNQVNQPTIPSPYGWPGDDATKAPGEGWEWKGNGPPGSADGNWTKTNPNGTTESLHPDLEHPDPKGPHWDYKDPSGKWWDVWPNGSMTPKP